MYKGARAPPQGNTAWNPAPTRGQPRLLDQVRTVIRRLHFGIRTEQTYVDWIRRFILFHRKRHPAEIGAPEVEHWIAHPSIHPSRWAGE